MPFWHVLPSPQAAPSVLSLHALVSVGVSATHLPAVQTGFALSLQSVLTLHSVFASSLLSSSSEQAWNPNPSPKTSDAAKIKRLSNFMFTSKKMTISGRESVVEPTARRYSRCSVLNQFLHVSAQGYRI